MIPTTCPHGKDPRMCAYCDKKDTSDCRCDKNTNVIWGDITGNWEDQTDLYKALSSLTTKSVPATLKIMDDNLYVVAPKGLIKDTDEPVFARNVKSSIRQKTDKSNYHYKRSGWIIPTHNKSKESKKVLVPLKMEKVNCWDSNIYDYYRILSAAATYNVQPSKRNYEANIGKELYDARRNPHAEFNIYFCNKKLGIAIIRNGVPITDWLPFTVTSEDSHKERYYLSRLNFGYQKK